MPVSYDKHGAIGVVTLSRPQARNAWGADFNEGLARHFAAMEDDDEIRCAILTGDEAGGAFSAGANLKDPRTHTQDSAAEFIKSIAKRRGRAFEVLGEFSKPIIGAVNGYAVGIGCIITFCCDLLVASEKAPPASSPVRIAQRISSSSSMAAKWRARPSLKSAPQALRACGRLRVTTPIAPRFS